MIYQFLSVALGGALGAMMRYGVGLIMTSSAVGMPAFVATISVNVVGCGLMGVMAGLSAVIPLVSESVRPLVMVGFLGGLTTFSSFAMDSFTLLEKQQYGMVAGYIAASFFVSLGAFFACYQLTKWGLS